jgi:hypothetical protein
MRTIISEPTIETKVGAALPLVRGTRLFVCAECRYAQLFVVQPRALCTRRGGMEEGHVVFAGQPACAAVAPRSGDEVGLSWFSPGRKATPSHIPPAGPHAA